MANVKFGGDNQSWDLTETLMDYTDVAGQAQTAEAKRALYERMLPAIMGEDGERKRMDTERGLREEIAKRKEKQAKEQAKAQGTDTGLETLSEVRPVTGDSSKSFVNRIANPQKGVSKTGPGGTLVGSQLGSAAFPSEIVQTTERTLGGDRGQRGALIRQGPISETTTRRIPNVLTAGDMLRAQQGQQFQDERMQLENKRLDYQIEDADRNYEINKRAQLSQIQLTQNRDHREQIDFNRAKAVADMTFAENLKIDYPNADPLVRTAVAAAYADNDIARVMELTESWGPGDRAKLAADKASMDLEKAKGEVHALEAKANLDNFKAGITLRNESNNPNFVGHAGYDQLQLQQSTDPAQGRHIDDRMDKIIKEGFVNGELVNEYKGPLREVQDQLFMRGKAFIVGESGFFGADANTSTSNVDDLGRAYLILKAGYDEKSPFKISAEEISQSKEFLLKSGLLKETADGLVPTKNNELLDERLNKATDWIYEAQKGFKRQSGEDPIKVPHAAFEPPTVIDKEIGVPLSPRENAERWRIKIREIDKQFERPFMSTAPRMDRQVEEDLLAARQEALGRLRGALAEDAKRSGQRRLKEAALDKASRQDKARELIDSVRGPKTSAQDTIDYIRSHSK